jgi:hypothetical protein
VKTDPPLPLINRIEALALDHDTKALAAVRAWLEAPADEWALVLLGTTGNGKSQAAALAWRVTPGALWLRTRELETMEWKARAEIIERAKRTALVVLDEVLAENEAATAIVGDIVESRGDDFRRTVMLGNGNMKAFFGRYGARLGSRLSPSDRWVVEVNGDDLRRKVRPILERPSMPWIPRGLAGDEAEAFKRAVFIRGLKVATHEHEAHLAQRTAATAAIEEVDFDAIKRRFDENRRETEAQSRREEAEHAERQKAEREKTLRELEREPTAEERLFIERRKAQIKAQVEETLAMRKAEQSPPESARTTP